MDEGSSNNQKPGWLERVSALLVRAPEDREQLIRLLHSAYERHLLDADALSMIEGALSVSELKVRDVTGGFRIWRRETLQGMPLARIRSTGYAFQVETIYVAACLGYAYEEVPIYFADRRWGTSKMSFRIQREAALRVWQILWRYRDLHAPEQPQVHSQPRS